MEETKTYCDTCNKEFAKWEVGYLVTPHAEHLAEDCEELSFESPQLDFCSKQCLKDYF